MIRPCPPSHIYAAWMMINCVMESRHIFSAVLNASIPDACQIACLETRLDCPIKPAASFFCFPVAAQRPSKPIRRAKTQARDRSAGRSIKKILFPRPLRARHASPSASQSLPCRRRPLAPTPVTVPANRLARLFAAFGITNADFYHMICFLQNEDGWKVNSISAFRTTHSEFQDRRPETRLPM